MLQRPSDTLNTSAKWSREVFDACVSRSWQYLWRPKQSLSFTRGQWRRSLLSNIFNQATLTDFCVLTSPLVSTTRPNSENLVNKRQSLRTVPLFFSVFLSGDDASKLVPLPLARRAWIFPIWADLGRRPAFFFRCLLQTQHEAQPIGIQFKKQAIHVCNSSSRSSVVMQESARHHVMQRKHRQCWSVCAFVVLLSLSPVLFSTGGA